MTDKKLTELSEATELGNVSVYAVKDGVSARLPVSLFAAGGVSGPFAYKVFPSLFSNVFPLGILSVNLASNIGLNMANGSFAANLIGGSITGANVTFNVVNGKIDFISINNRGLNQGGGANSPNIMFTRSANGISANAVDNIATIGPLINTMDFYWVASTDGRYLQLYQNQGYATPNVIANTTAATNLSADYATIADLGFLEISPETGIDVILGVPDSNGITSRIAIGYNRNTERVIGKIDALTAISPAYPSTDVSDDYVLETYQDANNDWQLSTYNRINGNVANITTEGNNVEGRLKRIDGIDYVLWRRTDVFEPNVTHLYARAEGNVFSESTLNKRAINPRRRLFALGDSLTEGSGSSLIGLCANNANAGQRGSWPARLQDIWGVEVGKGGYVHNFGIGGQTSEHIASRYNSPSQNITFTLENLTLPAYGTNGNVIFINPVSYAANLTSRGPLAPKANAQLRGFFVNNSIRYDVMLTTNSSYYYTMNHANPSGAEVTNIPGNTRFIVDLTNWDDSILVWCSGRNMTNLSQILIDDLAIANSIKSHVKKFFCVTIPIKRDNTENVGEAARITLDAINSAKKNAFPRNIFDINEHFQNTNPGGAFSILGITPTAQDNIDISVNVTPATFMSTDNAHLSDNGYAVWASWIDREITKRRW